MTQKQLEEMLHAQAESIINSDGFTTRFKTIITSMIDDLRNKAVHPMSQLQGRDLIANLPYARLSGDMLHTDSGSVLNLKNKNCPWVKASKEVGDWAVEFARYLKIGTIGKLMSETVDPSGGYFIPEDFKAIMIMFDATPTLVWSRGTVWPMTGEKMSMPRLMQNVDVNDPNFDFFAGVTFEWTEEGGEKAETQPEFGLLELIVHELAGYTEVTNTLLDDSVINLLNYLTRIFRDAWYWITDKQFIQGSGGKRPLGIVNDPGVLVVDREVADQVSVDDVINMEARLPSIFDDRGVWFITKKIRGMLRQQKSATTGDLLLRESFQMISEGYIMTLMGKPCVLADGKNPALGSVGDISYGDWSNYYIGFRQDFIMDSSRHYKFRNNRTSLRCAGRIDGQAAMPQSFVVLGNPS